MNEVATQRSKGIVKTHFARAKARGGTQASIMVSNTVNIEVTQTFTSNSQNLYAVHQVTFASGSHDSNVSHSLFT
jgi:hypothetical protein